MGNSQTHGVGIVIKKTNLTKERKGKEREKKAAAAAVVKEIKCEKKMMTHTQTKLVEISANISIIIIS